MRGLALKLAVGAALALGAAATVAPAALGGKPSDTLGWAQDALLAVKLAVMATGLLVFFWPGQGDPEEA